MTTTRISAVVPFYNNVDLLGDCLSSIAAQTMADLEVIMVDDGSTDGSAAIAADQAAADARFTLIRVPNGGPGSARNHGVAAATGAYLAFVDADDLLPPAAYATLLPVIEGTGSDLISGGVLRLTAAGLGPSGLHDQAIKARRLRTHISATPELLYDISVWNKLLRRSFWEAAGLAFPEGMLWEDLVLNTQAHVLAATVDVITDPIYHWRDRDKGAPSITQSRTSIKNFRDRITALDLIDAFLRDRSTPALLRAHQHKALVNDLWLYVRDLPVTTPGYQREFIQLASRYLRQVDRKVLASQPSARKLAYYLIEQDRADELIEFAGWLAANPARTPPMVRTFGRLRADFPLRRQAVPAIPARIFRPRWRELDPQVQVDRLSVAGRALVIEGSAYLPSMDIARRWRTSKVVLLKPHRKGLPPIVVPARSVRRPEVTTASGQDRYSYDWAGFRCEISPRWFGAGGRWLTGDWDCFVLVRGRAAWRPARLHSPGRDALEPQRVDLAPGVSLSARWEGRRLRVHVGRESAAVPADLPADQPGAAPARRTDPVRIRQSWTSAGQLLLSGTLPADGDSYQLAMRQLGGWEQHVVPVTGIEAGGAFSVAVPVSAMAIFGAEHPLRDGRWQLEPRRVGGAAIATELTGTDPRPRKIGRKLYRCSADPAGPANGLVIEVGPALAWYERGRIRRRLLRDLYYRAQRLLPARPAVVFMSFDGKSCTDNPRGIADELQRRPDARAQIWVVSDWSVPVPAGASAVLAGSAGYFAALGRAGYLIANDHMPQPYRPRAGQKYVQTWHGTPLKRLGYDIVNPSFASGSRYFPFLDNDVALWDLLISPNPFSTPIMRQAFKYEGEISESGYPRNDALLALHSDAALSEFRSRLGIPAGKRVAMYVPTWRDNQHDQAGRYGLDFQLDLAAAGDRLADDYVLLIRGHHLMAGWVQAASGPAGFVIDVTRHQDINDLLAITDVLITDYSSVMFDFAPTGRPMLFFTYDLDQYRDHLRGFYFDFEKEAPGPLLATSAQVVAALADLDAVAASYQGAHQAFTTKFCPLDDGKAGARACDRIFKD